LSIIKITVAAALARPLLAICCEAANAEEYDTGLTPAIDSQQPLNSGGKLARVQSTISHINELSLDKELL